MTAVMTEARKIEEPTLEDLRTFATRAEKAVERLSASLLDSQRRVENLTVERRDLVVPARSGRDARAQKRLNEIDEQLSILRRDNLDDETALTNLRAQLTQAQNNLERAEWELERASVRRMIKGRLEGKSIAAIQDAVDTLAKAMQTAKDEDEAINVAMLKFEPALCRDSRPLRMASTMRSLVAAYKLQKVLPVDTREFGSSRTFEEKSFAFFDHHYYDELIEALDRLELVF